MYLIHGTVNASHVESCCLKHWMQELYMVPCGRKDNCWLFGFHNLSENPDQCCKFILCPAHGLQQLKRIPCKIYSLCSQWKTSFLSWTLSGKTSHSERTRNTTDRFTSLINARTILYGHDLHSLRKPCNWQSTSNTTSVAHNPLSMSLQSSTTLLVHPQLSQEVEFYINLHTILEKTERMLSDCTSTKVSLERHTIIVLAKAGKGDNHQGNKNAM